MTEVKIFAIFGRIYCEFPKIHIRKHIRLCVRAALGIRKHLQGVCVTFAVSYSLQMSYHCCFSF